MHLPSNSEFKIRATLFSPRPHPVKLNNLHRCKARPRPQPDQAQGFPLLHTASLTAFPRPGNKSPWPCTYSTHPLIHTPQMTSPTHPYISVISCLFSPSLLSSTPLFPILVVISLCPFSLCPSVYPSFLFPQNLPQEEYLFNPTLH